MFIDDLNKSHFFKDPIVTEITPLELFYDAEEDHHDGLLQHHKTTLRE